MPQISRRRADQLRHFVLHLKLAAVDFEQIARAAVQHFGERFDGSCLAGAGRAEQQKDARGPGFGRKPGLVHLYVRDDLRHRFLLTDHAAQELRKKIGRRAAGFDQDWQWTHLLSSIQR